MRQQATEFETIMRNILKNTVIWKRWLKIGGVLFRHCLLMEIAVECALEACPIFCVCCWFYLGSVGVPLVLAHFLDVFFFFVFFDFVRFIWDYVSFVSILLGCT